MAQEQQSEKGPVPLKAVHIVLEATDGRLTKLTFTPDGTFDVVSQIARFASPQITERSVETLTTEAEADPHPQESSRPSQGKEKSPTTVIPGTLQSKPTEGNEPPRVEWRRWSALSSVEARKWPHATVLAAIDPWRVSNSNGVSIPSDECRR